MVRNAIGVLALIAVLLPVDRPTAWAQWTSNKVQVYGLFGPRTLGEPLERRPSQFRSGLKRGPCGDFVGRSANERPLVFSAYLPPTSVKTPFYIETVPSAEPLAPLPEVPVPMTTPKSPAPDTWFRLEAGTTGPGGTEMN